MTVVDSSTCFDSTTVKAEQIDTDRGQKSMREMKKSVTARVIVTPESRYV